MLRPAARRAVSRVCTASSRHTRKSLSTVAEEKDPVELSQLSTLPNGIRVASEALPGHFSGIGVYIDAGSRFENEYLAGVSHIIDRLAFKSTTKRDGNQIYEAAESLGGNIQCASSRESLMYQAATFNEMVPTTVGLLAETIRDPLITEEEVGQQLETAQYEIKEIWSKPELILPELVHTAAYRNNTLGNPLLCPAERLEFINRDVVGKYRSEFFKPERIVVAFAGVDHDTALKLTEQYFGDMKRGEGSVLAQLGESSTSSQSIDTSNPDLQQSIAQQAAQSQSKDSGMISKIPFFKNFSTSASPAAKVVPSYLNAPFEPLNLAESSHYTGGFLALPTLPPPLNPALPRLSYIHLAFEALPISHPDIYAIATLQTLLGGGGSFSAGGPGKGMYSRLYTQVLNQFHWVESCVAFNHSYSDSGLFGISASCSPQYTRQMLDVMCRQLAELGDESGWHRLQEGEVMRAKNQLRSNLLMNLEQRMIELEDVGRQVGMHGRKIGVKEMCEKIEAVTIKDLRRVARDVVQGLVMNPGKGSGAPTVVLQEGDEEGRKRVDLDWHEIQERIARWKLGRSFGGIPTLGKASLY
ncbi:hypothetical protein FKW77_004912 [Venturia effusa]|uniref:Mitochondrial-processing peptidase subunit alpha n=1 Tax=Venturia effusa TaxID=50376 RepID=A0A517LNV2_9PEZI|nr:hypothetical protein FKW77_004912 [Venturia effusa]